MRRLIMILSVTALLVAACGDSATDTTTEPATSTAPEPTEATSTAPTETTAPQTTAPADTTAPETTEAGSTSAPASADVVLGSSALGEHLTDAAGNTLYLFLPDEQGDSTCYDSCEQNWPPFAGEGAGPGLDPSLLGTTTRADGSAQTTYNGWPLYYFAADAAPGDTNGQGVGDVWYVIDTSGAPIQ